MTVQGQEEIDEECDRLKSFVEHEVDEAAKKCHISVLELMQIIEEVNIVQLHEAAHEAFKKISYAVDLTPVQIYEVFMDHREAPLEDLCKRLHETSMVNRSKF